MAEFGQPLNATGHARKFPGEGGEEGKPQAMPSEDSHANKTYFGRAGKLKAGKPQKVGTSGNAFRPMAGVVQRSRKRTK